MTITIEQQIASVKREIRMREYVYPGRVEKGKMKPHEAEHEISAMKAVLFTLENTKVPAGHCMLFVPQDEPSQPSPCAMAGRCMSAAKVQR